MSVLLSDNNLDIKTLSFDELPSYVDKEFLSGNGSGKEYATYLLVNHNGELVTLESDAMEPEDARFGKDLSWIPELLKRVYMLGAKAQLIKAWEYWNEPCDEHPFDDRGPLPIIAVMAAIQTGYTRLVHFYPHRYLCPQCRAKAEAEIKQLKEGKE